MVMHRKIRDKENKRNSDAMASNKFDLSSGNRGSRSMDRSGSFRESVDNSVSSSLPNVSRNSSSVGQSEVLNLLQSLPLQSKPTLVNLRSSSLQVNLRRNFAAAFGISADSSPSSEGKLVARPSQEELKRIKDGLLECSSKARKKIEFFDESISMMNKFPPIISTKKRSRSEVFSCDQSGPMLSNGCPMLGQGLGKVESQSNIISDNIEHDMQKTKKRSSRRRTSLADVKDMHGYGPTDRERELPKLANVDSVQSDDRTLPISDGSENSKMKKKRSVIEPDTSSGGVSTKPLNGYRERKQGIQLRSNNNSRPRLNSNSHGVRLGTVHEVHGAAKLGVPSQQTGLASRASNSKVDNDRDKERVNIKATNKVNYRDKFNSSSPKSNSRMSNPVRAPRSSSSAAPKLAPLANQASLSNDWEIGNCRNRPLTAVGDNNHSQIASERSSSPPSSELCTGKLQKTNQGRRRNLVPAASSDEDASPMDSGNESGLGFHRRMPASSPQLVNSKSEVLSSSPISEGEDSGAAEIKTRDRVKRSDEVEAKSGYHSQKLSTTVSSRKNTSVSREVNGGGFQKHGRAGREETVKQSKSKSESKVGRPPTRRLSDRNAFAQHKHTSVNSPADFPAVSDDGHKELLASANAIISPTHVSRQSFGSEKETLLDSRSDVDTNFLEQQENVETSFRMQNDTPIESVGDDHSMVSLHERLLSALISEEDNDSISDTDDLIVDDTNGSGHKFDGKLESNGILAADQEPIPDRECSGRPCDSMDINERILLEMHSVGIFPDVLMSCDHGIGGKNSNTKTEEQSALAFAKPTVERSEEFEGTGKSCFSETISKEISESGSSGLSVARSLTDTNGEASKTPLQNTDQSGVPSEVPMNNLPEPTTSETAAAVVSSTKRKRSQRSKEGKSGNSKSDGTSPVKVGRKLKTKKATQLSNTSDQSKQALASSSKSNDKVELHNPWIDDDTEDALDFSNLELPGMDVLGSLNDTQGQDIAAWLNFGDDNPQKHDDFSGLEGLEIPMDDLSDVNMMV